MNCNEYTFLLERRLDGALDDADARKLGAHLNECAACRAEEAAIAAADAAFQMLPSMEPPIDIAAAVSRRISREAPAESYRSAFWGVFVFAAVLAAFVWHSGFTASVPWGSGPVATVLGPLEHAVSAWWKPMRIALGAASPLLAILAPIAVVLTLLETGLASLFVARRAANVS